LVLRFSTASFTSMTEARPSNNGSNNAFAA
jgi:hypothetical protein